MPGTFLGDGAFHKIRSPPPWDKWRSSHCKSSVGRSCTRPVFLHKYKECTIMVTIISFRCFILVGEADYQHSLLVSPSVDSGYGSNLYTSNLPILISRLPHTLLRRSAGMRALPAEVFPFSTGVMASLRLTAFSFMRQWGCGAWLATCHLLKQSFCDLPFCL